MVASWVRMMLVAEVVQLLLVEALAGESQLQHRHAGGVVLNDEGRRRAGRQRAQLHLADGGDLGHGVADVDVRLEEDLDDPMPLSDCDSMCSMSLTVVVMPRSLLETMRLAISSRGEAGEVPHHRDDRDVDVGKDVRGHRLDAEDAEDQDQKRKDDEGIRPPQRKPDNPHKAGTRS